MEKLSNLIARLIAGLVEVARLRPPEMMSTGRKFPLLLADLVIVGIFASVRYYDGKIICPGTLTNLTSL